MYKRQGYGEGTTYASADSVEIEQGDGVYTFRVPAVDGINSIRLDNPYYGGALDVEYTVTLTKLPVITDFHGWRGFVIEMRGTNGVRRFSLNKDANGNVLFCLLCDTSSENPNGVCLLYTS